MDKKSLINSNNIPKHVAVIMDGNGRWAEGKGMGRIFGHKNALTAVRETIEASAELGTEAITLFAFSTENWKRPKLEINALMSLLITSLNKELNTFQENEVQVNAIGNIKSLPDKAQKSLYEVINKTRNNNKIVLTLALSYGAREEIINTIKNISKKVVNNELTIEEIDEKIINNHLYTFNLPDVDFRKEHFYDAIIEYQNRERRFGKTSNQITPV